MKISICDEYNMVFYLKKNYIKDIDFCNKEELEKYFKKLFNLLKDCYNLNIYGYYNIDVYIDKYYGIILSLEKEDIDYYDYFGSQIDMRIVTYMNSEFLYQINDYFDIDNLIIDKVDLYKYKGKFYLRIIKEMNSIELAKIIESGTIVYGDEINDIIKYGQIMNLKCILN